MKNRNEKLLKFINHNGYIVPTGKTKRDEDIREKIIKQFYNDWAGENTEKKVKNDSLKQFIHVNHLSKKETMRWGCLSANSTLTVLELSYVLKYAVKVGNDKPKNNANQREFKDIIIMECDVPKLRPYIVKAKLIVGVKREHKKIQYCLTAK